MCEFFFGGHLPRFGVNLINFQLKFTSRVKFKWSHSSMMTNGITCDENTRGGGWSLQEVNYGDVTLDEVAFS